MFNAAELRQKIVGLLKERLNAHTQAEQPLSTGAILEILRRRLTPDELAWTKQNILDIADHELAAYTHKGPSSVRFGRTMYPRLWHGPVPGKAAEPPKEKFPDRLAAMEARLNAQLTLIELKLTSLLERMEP